MILQEIDQSRGIHITQQPSSALGILRSSAGNLTTLGQLTHHHSQHHPPHPQLSLGIPQQIPLTTVHQLREVNVLFFIDFAPL